MNPVRTIALLTLITLAAVAQAQPVINPVSGDLVDRTMVTIRGSGFGAKSPAAPFRWDDFESGAPGDPVANWQYHSTYQQYRPAYSVEKTRFPGAQSVYQHYMDGNYGCALLIYPLPDFQEIYISGWWYNEVGGGLSRNTKILNLSGGEGYGKSAPPQNRTDMYPSTSSGHMYTSTPSGESLHDYSLRGSTFPGEWMRLERYVDVGTVNGNDGVSVIKRNLQDWARVEGTLYSDASKYTLLLITHYFAMDTGTPRPWMKSFWDEMYVDITPARIEIGDAPTWNACTHREIQIPQAWDNGNITFQVNQGSFPSGQTAYLYVVDSNDQHSAAGTPVTLVRNTDDDGSPGQPGRPQRIE